MSLCEACAKLDIATLLEKDTYEMRLGLWDDMVTQAVNGCKSCQFFVDYLDFYVTREGVSDVTAYFKNQEDDINRRYDYGSGLDEIDSDKYKDEVWINGMRILYKTARMVAEGSSSFMCDDLCLEICTIEQMAKDSDSEEASKDTSEDPVSKELDMKTNETTELQRLDHKRDIPLNPNNKTCFDLMVSWLRDCEGHGCQPQAAVPLPTRVMDVGTISNPTCKLIETNGQLDKYITLSPHCTPLDSLQLTTRTLSPSTAELPFDLLPQVYKDAIHIARSLSIPYLFISPICTLQDSPVSRSVYLNSTLHLSSSYTTSVFHDRRIQYSPPLGPSSLCLRPACLRWLHGVQESPAAQDPWALQSRILAPRVLHFTNRQMMYECAHGWKLEAANDIDKNIGSGQPGYEKARVQALLGGNDRTGEGSVEETARRYDSWLKIMQDMSGTKTRQAEEKLPSIAGVAAALDDGSLGKYFAGTWLGALEFGLAWSRSYKLLVKSELYRAPSWSWASVDGSVTAIWSGDLRGHLEEPGHWWKAHGVKLLETKMVSRDESMPYTGFMEGSFIRVEGSVVGMESVLRIADSETFRTLLILDTSNAFDCACCRADEEVRDTADADSGDGDERIKSCICMIVEGQGWVSDESKVHAVVLHPVKGEEEGTFERVGLLQIAFDWPDNEGRFQAGYEGKSVEEEFEEIGWERRVMKLI